MISQVLAQMMEVLVSSEQVRKMFFCAKDLTANAYKVDLQQKHVDQATTSLVLCCFVCVFILENLRVSMDCWTVNQDEVLPYKTSLGNCQRSAEANIRSHVVPLSVSGFFQFYNFHVKLQFLTLFLERSKNNSKDSNDRLHHPIAA